MTPINVVPEPPDRTVRIQPTGIYALVRADQARMSHGEYRWYDLDLNLRTSEWEVNIDEGSLAPHPWIDGYGHDAETLFDLTIPGPSDLYDLVMRKVGR